MGWTPLHAAANCPAVAATTIVELLLAAGAAVDARNGVRAQARTSLRAGCQGHRFQTPASLLGNSPIIHRDTQASEVNRICIRQDGATGLIAAAQRGNEAIVRLLLGRKADPSAADQVQRLRNLSESTPCPRLGIPWLKFKETPYLCYMTHVSQRPIRLGLTDLTASHRPVVTFGLRRGTHLSAVAEEVVPFRMRQGTWPRCKIVS